MSESATINECRRRISFFRRPWVVMGGITVLLLGALVYVFFKDGPPPDDADLLPVFRPGGGPDNPLAVFCREMEKQNLDDWRLLPAEAQNLERGQEAVLQAFLEKHEAELALFEGLMRSDAASWQWPAVDGAMGAKTPFAYLSSCMPFTNKVAKCRVLLHTWAGRHQEALSESLKLAQFGNRLANLSGPLIHHLVAITIQRVGEQSVRSALLASTDAALLQKAQEALSPLDLAPTTYAEAMRCEYLFSRNSPSPSDPSTYAVRGFKAWQCVAVSFATLPNRTTSEYGGMIRSLTQGLEQDWAQGLRASDEISRRMDDRQAQGPLVLLKPNPGGRILLMHTWGAVRHMLPPSCAASALHRMTVVTLALHRHELAHGRTPEMLEELVPEFLPAVPLDPFDNQPLRWDAEKKWLYSIGSNGVDDYGAHTTPEKVNGLNLDIVMPYWWLPQPEEQQDGKPAVPLSRGGASE